jgi:hypothetical protein
MKTTCTGITNTRYKKALRVEGIHWKTGPAIVLKQHEVVLLLEEYKWRKPESRKCLCIPAHVQLGFSLE